MLTDLTFRVPGISLAEAQVTSGQPDLYMYLFDFRYHYAADPRFRATHGSEGAFVFNTTEATEVTRGDIEARQLATKIHASRAAVAREGSPRHDGLKGWAPYNTANRPTMLLAEDPRIVHDPEEAERAEWRTGEI
jgi:para-nitrobenzyl esterase